MSAKDRFHDAVKIALQKDGWRITDEPLTIPVERLTNMFIDIAAEKLIMANRDSQKIAVEVKSFLSPSTLSDFHLAIGQFINYRYALEEYQPERILYLAVPAITYEEFFTTRFIQTVIQRSQINLLIFEPTKEEIFKWQS
ncbi:XisH family protein [Nostoc spongiaeforme FACHB-130]|uniref:XisH family protein n=1 Tax=Nostoc spongiaeforme FACHB-130 TaxID=1357510 RepID=A0ABR8G107_9NOSO|nr:XisH family protein [Nostoc spongiaeforme]MBD2596898.1 XisH family protein [Nostoc spongiaeforme FACHB-130]